MPEDINHQRRRFLGATALSLAVAELAQVGPARAQSSDAAFGPIKQIDAGELNIGYAEAGPIDGKVAVPSGPGLGLDPDPNVIDRYRVA